MALTRIEWTEAVWNPVTGCSKVSPGCAHCYAERMALRLQAMGQPNYARGFEVTVHEQALAIPYKWKKPRVVFVNSMSDLFHEEVPLEFVQKVFQVMVETPRHTYQVLTKRSRRLAELAPHLPWPANVWAGVSVENADYFSRLEDLQQVPAKVKFVSFEPLLGPVDDFPLAGLDWVIVGGESGPGARPMKAEWVRAVRDKCVEAGVPFFFKQWGGVLKHKTGRVLDGRTWEEAPERASLDLPGLNNA